MSSVDKFVLVPYDRYEQLMRDNEDVKGFEDKDKDIAELELERGKETIPEEKKELQSNTQLENTTKDGVAKKEESKNNIKGDFLSINKVPARPPGIPNRNKKRIKWESLF